MSVHTCWGPKYNELDPQKQERSSPRKWEKEEGLAQGCKEVMIPKKSEGASRVWAQIAQDPPTLKSRSLGKAGRCQPRHGQLRIWHALT